MSHATTLPAPELDAYESQPDAWEAERRAFHRLSPGLLSAHRGNYVAIYQGAVVAQGTDQIEVAMQAYGQFGYVPIYVGLVSDEPPRPVRVPSPRVVGQP